jgi:hypothetical protein
MIRKKKNEDLDFEDEITEFHQLPNLDSKEHVPDVSCWCIPKVIYKNPESGNEIWLHNLTQ